MNSRSICIQNVSHLSLFYQSGEEVTAEGILSALNGCYKRVLGGSRQPLRLIELPPQGIAPILAEGDMQKQRQDVLRTHRATRWMAKERQQHVAVVDMLERETTGYWTNEKTVFWVFVTVFR